MNTARSIETLINELALPAEDVKANGHGVVKSPPVCPQCSGMGFVVPDVPPKHPRFGKSMPCICKMDKMRQKNDIFGTYLSQLSALQHQTFDTFIPEGLGFSIRIASSLRKAYDRARAFAEQPNGWLLLTGTYGCGKTHLAAAIANHTIKLGKPVLFVTVPDLLDHLRSTYRPGSHITYDKLFDQVRNTPLLILDDLGAHNHSDWAQEKLFQVINHRYNTRLPMVITTNQEMDTIEIRIRSRLGDMSVVDTIPISAPDFRRGGVNQDEATLSSLSTRSHMTFDTFDIRERELSPQILKNLHTAYSLAREFAQAPEGWLVFHSDKVNGKTHLAAAIANEISRRREEDLVIFATASDILGLLRETFDSTVSERLHKRLQLLKTASVLIVDDLGGENETGWTKENLSQLLYYRYDAKLPTVITTSKNFKERDPRLYARFMNEEICVYFSIFASSYVGKKHKPSNGDAHIWNTSNNVSDEDSSHEIYDDEDILYVE